MTFGFSFLILINFWNRYTTTTSVLPVETVSMVRVNILLLFLVAIEPFLFDVMFVVGLGMPVGKEASLYYGLDIGGMNFILAYFTHLVSVEEKNLIPRELVGSYRISRNALIATAGILPLFRVAGVRRCVLRRHFDSSDTLDRFFSGALGNPILWGQMVRMKA